MKNIIFLLKNLILRPSALREYRHLNKSASSSVEELNDAAFLRAKELFIHAKKTVPYYTNAFKDIQAEDLRSLKDWEKLPLLTKADIKNNFNDLISLDATKSRLREVTTGGSTGVPLKLFHDRNYPVDVIGWRVLGWWSVFPSDDIAFIYRKVKTGWKAILNSIMWYPTRRIFLDASMMNSDSMSLFYMQLSHVKPPLLQGYVGAVFEFAQFCQENRLKLDFLKGVWVTSAPLSEPQRQLMELVFRCPVYDQYGCSEIFWLAAQCSKKDGLHVFSDLRHIEVLDSVGKSALPGEYGDIVVTDLVNFAFPLIRYVNGDRGRYMKYQCSCGLPFPIMDRIKGRISDVIRLPSRKIVAGEYLTTIFDDHPEAVKEFQICQEEDYSIHLFCVLGIAPNSIAICNQKIEDLRRLVSNEVNVVLFIVESISHHEGKTRFIVSKLK